MSRNYRFHNPKGVYFVTFTCVQWIDVFVKDKYVTPFIDCIVKQQNKGLNVHAFCIMTNHVHMIISAQNGNPGVLVNQIKSQFTKKYVNVLKSDSNQARRDRIMKIIATGETTRYGNPSYMLWMRHNKPIELWSNYVIDRYLNYTHNNPVKAGFVIKPYHWKYSSASAYVGDECLLDIDLL